MTADDGHGPQYGCSYFKCGIDSQSTCPFVKDDAGTIVPIVDHQHEWRQYWVALGDTRVTPARYMPGGFYCIHCKLIEN